MSSVNNLIKSRPFLKYVVGPIKMLQQHLSLLLILKIFIFEERPGTGCMAQLHLLKKRALL